MSAQAILASNYVNQVRQETGRWPEYKDVCNAVNCSIDVATRAINLVKRWWENSCSETLVEI